LEEVIMAIEDFEWEGDIEAQREPPVTPRVQTPGLLARVRKSVWLEPALRLAGMALLLAVLAGIGVVATTYAKPGMALPEQSRSLAAALGTSWLKPTAPTPEAHAPALAVPPAAASAAASSAPVVADSAPPPTLPGLTADGKVILNAASADELTKLPGVGMKRAQAIVALRTKLKRFKNATDLLRVKGIGPRGLQRMLPHLVLDAPAASS
jgi:competence protein ComEA